MIPPDSVRAPRAAVGRPVPKARAARAVLMPSRGQTLSHLSLVPRSQPLCSAVARIFVGCVRARSGAEGHPPKPSILPSPRRPASGTPVPRRASRRALALMTGPACVPPFPLRLSITTAPAVMTFSVPLAGSPSPGRRDGAPAHNPPSPGTYCLGKEVYP